MKWLSQVLNGIAAVALVTAVVAQGTLPAAHADDLSDALENRPQHVATDWSGLAAAGYDVVAFFTDRMAEKGKRSITAAYDGATYQFASEANRDLFLKDPASLIPQFGGFDAYGVRSGQKVRPVKGIFWHVADEKLFIFGAEKTKAAWLKNADGNKRVADALWAQIRTVPVTILRAATTE
jgi:YHS domain-containing protein